MGVSRHESRAGSRSAHAATGGSLTHALTLSERAMPNSAETQGCHHDDWIGSGSEFWTVGSPRRFVTHPL